MYKKLGKICAAHPGIAKQESDKKEAHDYAFILYFIKANKGETRKHKKIIKDCSRRKGREEFNLILKKFNPLYIVLIHKYANYAPEIIREIGDKTIIDMF
ncbi:MAG: hypothetical protein AAB596_00200 [Patescibacteria group bacterium]